VPVEKPIISPPTQPATTTTNIQTRAILVVLSDDENITDSIKLGCFKMLLRNLKIEKM